MIVQRVGPLSAVLVLLAAGCIVDPETPNEDNGPATAPDAGFTEDTGGIKGFVLDEETQPIAGASLSLVPLGALATSASDGSFAFSNVPPATYTLYTSRLGYQAGATQVSVLAGEVKNVMVAVSKIEITAPRSEVYGPFSGFMQCRMSTPLSSGACGFVPVVGNTTLTSVWTNDKVIWNFGKFTSEDFAAIVFEARWTPSSAATNPNMNQIFSYDGRPGTHWWADSGAASSPVNFVWVRGEDGPGGQVPSGTPEEHEEPTSDHTLRTWLTIPFGSVPPAEVAYELRFEMMVTVYYSSLPPEGYSGFSDA